MSRADAGLGTGTVPDGILFELQMVRIFVRAISPHQPEEQLANHPNLHPSHRIQSLE